ncbi:MAG: hypothetical protein C0404_13095 [Verrucomicrobia bacterium]|nr:hypothetical protein [Verrucomicrobiota bacterium]
MQEQTDNQNQGDSPLPPPVPISIPQLVFSCACGTKLKVPISLLGKQVKCPACSKTVIARPSPEIAAMIEQAESGEESLTPMARRVQAEMDRINSRTNSLGKNIVTFLITMAVFILVFAAFGFFKSGKDGSFSILNVVILMAALMFHEVGHLIAMKIFGYKDVRMFFIPMLGAAVSGSETTPDSTHKAVVSLCGPVPGILLGTALGISHFVAPHPFLRDACSMLLLLNIFNLLPFHPLDGGRFFDDILLSRSPVTELWFKAITTSLLLVIALLINAWLLAAFAVLVLISLRSGYATSLLASDVRNELPAGGSYTLKTIPPAELNMIVDLLQVRLHPAQFVPSVMAPIAMRVWNRVCDRPATVTAIVLLLMAYAAFLALGLIFGIVWAILVIKKKI